MRLALGRVKYILALFRAINTLTNHAAALTLGACRSIFQVYEQN